MKAQFSGTCQCATLPFRNSARSTGSVSWLTTTQASGRSVHFSSGMPITAASTTSGLPTSRFSSSTEEIHSPPDLITSLSRSEIWK